MKKILLISIVILTLTAVYGYAQMGGGMMGGQNGQDKMGGGMMGGQQEMGQGGMMMQVTNQMGSMMQRMSGMLEKSMGPEDTTRMSEIMRDMSKQMMDMSNIMQSGNISRDEMQMLQQKMMETEKKFDMMR